MTTTKNWMDGIVRIYVRGSLVDSKESQTYRDALRIADDMRRSLGWIGKDLSICHVELGW
jgi:hypothetical protein